MKMMTLGQALAWIQKCQPEASLVGQSNITPLRVHTDTRTLREGDLFVALRGERFDAHAFLPQARTAGACAALAQSGLREVGLDGIEAPDTLQALGSLAAGWRAQWAGALVAVTGSNGKTTVTQMIASIFREAAGPHSLATEGNLNNAIGVPLTLLRLQSTHRLAVVELGMNHPGEIASLAAMTQPTVALVSNAQREHLEFMGTVDAVAQENGQVLCALAADGVAVFPAKDAFTSLWRKLAGQRACLTFGVETLDADVSVQGAHWHGDAWQFQIGYGDALANVTLRMAGRHNLHNAAAAAASALAAGVSLEQVAQGLTQFSAVTGRSHLQMLPFEHQRLTLIDDTYNANPDSVRAAIDVLADLPAPRLLVLGDMGEVGEQGAAFHEEVGRYAQARGVDGLLCLGALSRHAAQAHSAGLHFESMELLQQSLLQSLPGIRSVVIKGSRFMRMERAVQALQQAYSTSQAVADKESSCS